MFYHTRFTLLLLSILLLMLCSSASFAGVVYVKWDSPYDGPGNDWGHAYHTVQAGLNAAVSGDEVWVAAGTYVENITLKEGVGLYGGFAGAETARDQRDRRANITTLDGNRSGSVVTAPPGATGTAVIDGFTIRNGSASTGGGIHCYSSSPNITNNTITGNGAYDGGGGVYCWSSSPTIKNNTITRNSAFRGGGIYCENSSSAIAHNTIARNSAREGGAICMSYSSLMMTNNTIAGNSAYKGGGVYCSVFSPRMTNNTVTGNSASYGGGIYCQYSSPAIANNTITGNSAGYGGGIYCKDCSPSLEVTNNIIAFNSSGVCRWGGGITLRHNCVYGNTDYDYDGLSDPTGNDGNISVDPQLAAVVYGNVHIQADSPCVDAGDDGTAQGDERDMDGQARIQGTRVDIGADESDGTMWTVSPAIIRVSADGDDGNDGSSWASAKRTVQAAIDAALLHGGEVWVKAGIYNERIILSPHAHLYGGFAGTEVSREERDWISNVTGLDGEHGGSVVRVYAGHMLSTIDGFTIRNGNADRGAGLYCDYSSATIANNTVTGNSAGYGGGGIGCWGCPSVIRGNTIMQNSARHGGAIECWHSSSTITNNVITGNTAQEGGGVFCLYAAPKIAYNTVVGNSANWRGGGIYCSSSSPAIVSNRIAANSAAGDGGGIYSGYSSAAITNNTITRNSAAGDGGGIYCQGSSSSSEVINNIVAFNSSGVYNSFREPTLRHNCVYANTQYDYSGLSPGVGDISEDPLLMDLPGGDYHLTPVSPCIDAGDDTVVQPADRDIDGQPRQVDIPGKGAVGTLVDIGADELWPIFVAIDIKPGEYPNAINLRSRGVIPVAILTTEDFDATTVDPATVEMAGSGVATRGKKDKLLFSQSDVDKDGDTDLLMHFDTQNLALDAGATEAVLTGEMYDGTLIQGSDSVVVILKE